MHLHACMQSKTCESHAVINTQKWKKWTREVWYVGINAQSTMQPPVPCQELPARAPLEFAKFQYTPLWRQSCSSHYGDEAMHAVQQLQRTNLRQHFCHCWFYSRGYWQNGWMAACHQVMTVTNRPNVQTTGAIQLYSVCSKTAPQIRSHDFWHYINSYVCMYGSENKLMLYRKRNISVL